MAKKTRTKEIWHIPKRVSVHQTIYMVNFLSENKFHNKSWTHTKQENLSSEMAKAGVTKFGRALTSQSIRTILADIPKFLGFVYVDKSSRPPTISVTDVGFKLIEEFNIDKIPKHKKLSEYARFGDLIDISKVFKEQMLKLIITNPAILKDCENILVFPFRMTLKALTELKYLDIEEIGYILFHIKSEDEYPVLIERIKNFRSLGPDQRTTEIEAYNQTEEGKLTVRETSATSKYYTTLCYSTGLCDKINVNVNKNRNSNLLAVTLKEDIELDQIFEMFEDTEIYDFGNNLHLWNKYFSVPDRLYPPHDLSLQVNSNEEVFVLILKDEEMVESDLISENNKTLVFPVFRDEDYKIIIYDIEGKEVYNNLNSFSKDDNDFIINIKSSKKIKSPTLKETANKIKEMINSQQGFDGEYYRKLKTIEKFLGRTFTDSYRKGGRFEYLFFELLFLLKSLKIIDDVYWFGEIGKYGICKPATGGKYGNPDIIFEVDEYLLVLELTTIRGTRAQWDGSEASSVPDHISKFKNDNPHKKVIGIFSAPSIHPQLEKNLKLNANHEGMAMLFEPAIDFSEFLITHDREEIKNYFVGEAIKQNKLLKL